MDAVMCQTAPVDVIQITREKSASHDRFRLLQSRCRASFPALPLHILLTHSEIHPMNFVEANNPETVSGMGARTMWVQLDEESVISANSQFWEQVLAMKLEPVLMPMARELCVGNRHRRRTVKLSGMWKGPH